MFESLGDRLQAVVSKIKGYGKITEENISEIVRDIRLALLEADVNYTVVKEFTNKVKEKALGEEVQKSLKPSELFVKIVKDELVDLLGVDTLSSFTLVLILLTEKLIVLFLLCPLLGLLSILIDGLEELLS